MTKYNYTIEFDLCNFDTLSLGIFFCYGVDDVLGDFHMVQLGFLFFSINILKHF